MPRSESLSRFRLKTMLEVLASKEGRGTELVTLYVPPGRQISEVMNMLRQEYGTASNIKSDTTRKNVQDAITRVMSRLKLFKEVPETGLAIFCGAIPQDGPGSERLETYVVIPPEPVGIYLYRCDSRFHIEPLMELLREKEAYGILVLDASSATYAVLRGRRMNIIRKITSDVPSKHRAGGMSAQRFKRVREAKLVDFFKRIGKHAKEAFLGIPDLKGIIIAGPGPTKYDFLKGDYLHYGLREKVVGTLDTAYTEEQGVEEVVDKAPEIISRVRYVEEKRLIQEFLYHISHDTELAVYGGEDVRRNLEMGNVKLLLISEGVDVVRVYVKCSSCGYTEEKTMSRRDAKVYEQKLPSTPCPSCGATTLRVDRVENLIEDLAELGERMGARVEIISVETEEGEMLLKSFGGIAAILRFKPS